MSTWGMGLEWWQRNCPTLVSVQSPLCLLSFSVENIEKRINIPVEISISPKASLLSPEIYVRIYTMNDIETLRDEYLTYTKKILPQLARQHKWVVYYDHCFQRILLDNLFQMCWYDAIEKRPAYKQLSVEQLQQAITLAKSIEQCGDEYLRQLNTKSLEWRRKL